ncbi:helix-turn-helix transcriptional regulator [Streptomyces sp. CB01881]|uniref:helix-turn-helix domain-containing protein n=1 Tax=Streptomyces sp. CB01881 TaxID=2078691 RepID=UPI000CDC9A2B|nr:helix-turn-helix transcriptional regulator [Streptomyces sp. CB01881]AUY50261.1 XRE family transcriptional regulator [Streptomyces sp. CB01881]TYC73649.1 XRE family transcriptional regulator [Streptomyces sp. CB01881]
MALRTQVSERQRRFGAELRRLREAADMAVKDAGALVGMGGPQLSHIEAGRTGLDPVRLATLLASYGHTDETYAAALREMGLSDGKGWWTKYKGFVHPSALDLAESESTARSLDSYETLLIPGLLQVPRYSEIILDNDVKKVEFRRHRQRAISGTAALPFHAVIHEAALHSLFGGPAVMREQLDYLVAVSELPHVTIQVLPFRCTEYVSTDTSFMIVRGPHSDLDTVLMEHPGGSAYLGEPEAVDAYRAKFERLKSLALPALDNSRALQSRVEHDSWGLIQHIRYTL